MSDFLAQSVIVWPLIGFLAGLAIIWFRAWRAHRAERQVQAEQLMRRGFRAASRMGWIRDDVQ